MSTSLQPAWQERIGVGVDRLVPGYVRFFQQLRHRAVIARVEQFRCTPDVLAADIDLRNGLQTGALQDGSTNFAALVILLLGNRVEIDRAVGNLVLCEHLAYRPGKLTPLERE